MRTKMFRLMLPAFVIGLAVFSAFAFTGSGNQALLAPETGWINLPGEPCAIRVQCDAQLGPVCTAVYNGQTHQAFGKINPESMTCTKVLYRTQVK